DSDSALQVPNPNLVIPFPRGAAQAPQPFNSPDGDRVWSTPRTLDELAALMRGRGQKKLRIVHGNTSFGVYPDEYWDTNLIVAVEALVQYQLVGPEQSTTQTEPLADLLAKVKDRPQLADEIVLLSYAIPVGAVADVTLAQKVALRDVNSHSIVNATTRLSFGA